MTLDAETESAGAAVKAALEQHFGSRLAGVYLFGSRARGRQRPDSDIDIAVVLHDPDRPLSMVDRELLDITYPVEIEHGIHIQAWALPSLALSTGEGSFSSSGIRAELATAVRSGGVPL